MRVLVTGGAGFIGSHLVDGLITAGNHVTVLDDLSFGKKEYIHSQAQFHLLDITDPVAASLVEHGAFDCIIHCAAQKNLRYSLEHPVEDARANVMGLLHVLEGARRGGTKQFLFLSSGGTVYGQATHIPTPETAPLHPQSPYGVSKVAGEFYVQYYAEQYGMCSASLRLSNVYGTRQDPHGEAGVISIFCERIAAGKPLVIHGSGAQTRDFIHISDVVSGCMRAIGNLDEPGAHHYNIGAGIETSVIEIAEIIQRVSGKTAQIEHDNAIVGELMSSAVDCNAFFTHTGWKPALSLEQGIQQTYQWFAEGQRASH